MANYIHVVSVLLTVVSLAIKVNCQCDNGYVHFDASCYLFSHDKEGWSSAAEICKGLGGYLAEIGDVTENSFLVNKVQALKADYWIGGEDLVVEGVWKWYTSNTPVTFTAWSPGQPSNSGLNENCMEIWPAARLWNDDPCSNVQPYVCEKPIEGAEIVG